MTPNPRPYCDRWYYSERKTVTKYEKRRPSRCRTKEFPSSCFATLAPFLRGGSVGEYFELVRITSGTLVRGTRTTVGETVAEMGEMPSRRQSLHLGIVYRHD